jgi:hypothetical protein
MKGMRLTVAALVLMSGAALAFASVPDGEPETKAYAVPPPTMTRSSEHSDMAGLLRQQVSLMREQADLQRELIALQRELLAQGQLYEGRRIEEGQSRLSVNEQKGKTDE